MDLPQETDDYIRESIEYTLGIPVSTHTLELKLRASQDAQRRLRDQYLYLRSQLKDRDDVIEGVRAESSMNALALKKFVEENQKLAAECTNLLGQSTKWERECSLYDNDREALMDFANEADERAKEAEVRIHELEEELSRVSGELQLYKHQSEIHPVDTSAESTSTEHFLFDSLLSTLVSKDEVESLGHSFLEANSGVEVCQRMLKMWNSLQPSTQKVLALASEVKILQKDKDHLRINLTRAEEEVKVLFEENSILDEENKRLIRQRHREKHHSDSGGKPSKSESAKSNKRKSSPKTSSPIEKLDFCDYDSPRQPFSLLQQNSPESRMHKKLYPKTRDEEPEGYGESEEDEKEEEAQQGTEFGDYVEDKEDEDEEGQQIPEFGV